jgi:lipoyl(octanoyl) transferase
MSTAAAPLRWLWLGTVGYPEAWALQRRLARARGAGELEDDCLLLLEHPPVYTMGRNGRPEHVPGGAERLRALGAEYLEVDRGGSVTFHGPGQLVGYPIVRLAAAFPVPGATGQGDVLRYVRALEEALIGAAAAAGAAARRAPRHRPRARPRPLRRPARRACRRRRGGLTEGLERTGAQDPTVSGVECPSGMR